MPYSTDLFERVWTYKPVAPSQFVVDYYAISPKGTQARFQRRVGVSQIRGNPRSETAIWLYLQRLHPKCSISILSLEFK